MFSFILFAIIKFEWFIKEKEYEYLLFDTYVKYELRFSHDDKSDISLKGFIKEYQELNKKNYPQLSCAYHFGFAERKAVQDLLMFNASYQSHCRKEIEHGGLAHLHFYGKALEETKDIHRIYDKLDDALTEHLTLFKRRKALFLMKNLMDEKDFYKGVLPPIVPIWYFEFRD